MYATKYNEGCGWWSLSPSASENVRRKTGCDYVRPHWESRKRTDQNKISHIPNTNYPCDAVLPSFSLTEAGLFFVDAHTQRRRGGDPLSGWSNVTGGEATDGRGGSTKIPTNAHRRDTPRSL